MTLVAGCAELDDIDPDDPSLDTEEWALESTVGSGTASAAATFHSIGIVWRPELAPTASERPTLRYRVEGTTTWRLADPLLFGWAAPNSLKQRAPEFRGSLIQLRPNTSYEILLQRGTVTKALKARTWSETFPTVRTKTIYSRTTPLVITEGGSASTGYVVYEAAPGAVIDVNNAYDNCVTIRASYVIVRGFTMRDARATAVAISPPTTSALTNVVIERNDIANWGRAQSDGFARDWDAAIGAQRSGSVGRLIVQRNVIHAPRYDANSWYQRRSYLDSSGQPKCDVGEQCHPQGAVAITAIDSFGNNVFRYNRVYGGGKRFNDIFGGGGNFSFRGFPGNDSDIYGNDLADAWDDGIEAEGGNRNVRIWGNRIDRTYVGIGAATTSVGPLYVFRNVRGDARVSDVALDGTPLADNDPRMMFGPFLKTAPRRYSPTLDALVDENNTDTNDAKDAAGPIRVFHNTVLQPYSRTVSGLKIGSGRMVSAHQAAVRNTWLRNNIVHMRTTGSFFAGPMTSPGTLAADTRNSFNYDMTNIARSAMLAPHEANGYVETTPTYITGTLQLASGTPGRDDALRLPGLNDRYAGGVTLTAPDRGAVEAGLPAPAYGENASW